MTSNVSDAAIVHRMKVYRLVLPASGGTALTIHKAWSDRMQGVFGDLNAGVKEMARLFPYIVSWELTENLQEMTVQEEGPAVGVDDMGILTIAANLGFNPPVSNEEMFRWKFKSTGIISNVKLVLFLNNRKVSWGTEGAL